MTLNRLSGLVVAGAGAVLLFWITPTQTELVDSGWLRPATLPNITSIAIIITGLIHFIFPSGKEEFDWRLFLRVGMFFVICLLALYLMKLLGFLAGAPALVLAVMLLIGERRWLWLISGVVLIPAVIWVAVAQLLDRPLP